MSVDVALTLDDYKRILSWFELAFAKASDMKEGDNITFRKLSVMAQVTMEEHERDKETT